jgi:hypothetical protein
VVAGALGCSSGPSPVDDAPPSTAVAPAPDPLVALEVVRPDGGIEQVYAVVEVPDHVADAPVLVFAHGQSREASFRCAEGPPDDAVVEHARLVAKGFAEEGWLVVAPLFRNRGPDVPLTGALHPRDHHLLDAAALLAAAHHGVAQPEGRDEVALLGLSMGSFPALWAATDHPDLAGLHDGLDLRIAISGAMLGDHLGNVGRTHGTLSADEELARAEAITLAVTGAVQFTSFERGHDPVVTVDFADDLLTERGLAFADAALLTGADPSLPGCEGVHGAPICATECVTSTFYEALGDAEVQPEAFLQPAALDALSHWDSTAGADPGPASDDPLLASLRAASPAYGLPPAVAERLAVVVSKGDHVVQQQLAYGDAPVERFRAALQATGAAVDWVDIEADGCGHEDYLLPHRPECGFDAVRGLLTDSLSPAGG